MAVRPIAKTLELSFSGERDASLAARLRELTGLLDKNLAQNLPVVRGELSRLVAEGTLPVPLLRPQELSLNECLEEIAKVERSLSPSRGLGAEEVAITSKRLADAISRTPVAAPVESLSVPDVTLFLSDAIRYHSEAPRPAGSAPLRKH